MKKEITKIKQKLMPATDISKQIETYTDQVMLIVEQHEKAISGNKNEIAKLKQELTKLHMEETRPLAAKLVMPFSLAALVLAIISLALQL